MMAIEEEGIEIATETDTTNATNKSIENLIRLDLSNVWKVPLDRNAIYVFQTAWKQSNLQKQQQMLMRIYYAFDVHLTLCMNRKLQFPGTWQASQKESFFDVSIKCEAKKNLKSLYEI